jgi:purine-cytosine permease-like protein
VAAVTVAATALSLVVSQNFLADFTVFLQLLLYLFAPWTAINLTDYFLVRRGHYDLAEIFNPRGLYGRFSWRGGLAYLIGFAAEIPFTSTTLYTGPVAHSLGGADLSPFVGVLVGGLAYWATTRSLDTRSAFTTDSALP